MPSSYESIRYFVRNGQVFNAPSIRLNKAVVAKCGIPSLDNFVLLHHQDAVNSNRKSVEIDDGHSVSSFR